MPSTPDETTILEVERRAAASGAFGAITHEAGGLCCAARASSAPAHYGVRRAGGQWVVSLATADRWLSESIESALLHTRDTIEDLLLDELKDRDWMGGAVGVKHFRDEQKRFVFEAALACADGGDACVTRVSTLLLSFEATFAQLGDMSGSEAA